MRLNSRSAIYNNRIYLSMYLSNYIYKPHDNHKPKTCNKYTHTKKESKYNMKDSSNHKGIEQEKKKGTKKNYKTTQKQSTKWQLSRCI